MTINEYDNMIRNMLTGDNEVKTKDQVKKMILQDMKTKIIRRASYNYDYTTLIPSNLSKYDKQYLENYVFMNRLDTKILKTVRNASEHGRAGILERIGQKSTISQNVFI